MKLPIASDAWRFVIPLAVAAGVCFWMPEGWVHQLGVLLTLAALFCLYFFRDFERHTAIDDKLIYSPADGKVLEVSHIKHGPHSGWILIRIFLSVMDVHVQRAPISGRVTSVTYTKGKFLDARHPEAHLQNEQSEMQISSERGNLFVTQIAGLIARRIVTWAKLRDSLRQGQRYGLIRFGSQVDVVVPPNIQMKVAVGHRVVGGTTVLAEWTAR